MPTPATQHSFQLAFQHHLAGRLHEAQQLYRQILATEPQNPDALHMLGIIAHQVGQPDLAIKLMNHAIALNRRPPEAYCDLGNALRDKGNLDDAIASYRHAIALKPDYAEAYSNLGNALRDKGLLDESIAACRHALSLKPHFPEALCNLANALKDKGLLEDAIAAYRQAVALNPRFAIAFSNLGNALRDQARPDEAIAAYRQAIALNPNFAEAHSNLGNALRDQGRPDEAIADYQKAVALNPAFAEAQNNLGNALKDKGQLDPAIAAYRQAIALNPNYPKAHSNLIYALCYHPQCDAVALAQEQRRWNQQHAEPLRQFIQPHPNDRDPNRRLRIGYVSADFYDHASAYFLLPLMQHHDPQQVDLFAYAQITRPDPITRRFQQLIPHWRSTLGLSDEQAARQIRDDQIDILVDLKLHTENNRLTLFARKPAPLQLTWLGFPGSTGLTAIDYRLTDPHLDPPGIDESVYSEKTLRLPHTFWCYDPLDSRDVPLNPLPALANRHITFGCLNNFCKINDAVLHLWAKVLNAVPASRLLLLSPEGQHRQRSLDLFEKQNIAPHRIEFIPRLSRRKYLELYHRLDISLDTFPYNGHTTSLDSLFMGVPLVTLIGQTIVGRAGLSQLTNLNLPELAARTPDEFIQIATSLAADLPRLTHLRQTLRQLMQSSPLMNAPQFARDIESAYRQIWHTHCRQHPSPNSSTR